MEKFEGSNLVEHLNRRLHPVKVTVNLLTRELELASGDSVTIPKEDMISIISTLDVFIEDHEKVTKIPSAQGERRLVGAAKKTPAGGPGASGRQ